MSAPHNVPIRTTTAAEQYLWGRSEYYSLARQPTLAAAYAQKASRIAKIRSEKQVFDSDERRLEQSNLDGDIRSKLDGEYPDSKNQKPTNLATMAADAYANYLRSPHWEGTKNRVWAWYRGQCAECNSCEQLEVHHYHYRSLGRERIPHDVVLLCRWCHADIHGVK